MRPTFARRSTSGMRQRRGQTLAGRLVVAAATGIVACRSTPLIRHLEAASPGATFEVRLSRCVSTGESEARFGSDLRTALLWSRERVHNARYYPCSATIDAVRPGVRRAVYHLSMQRDGSYAEGPPSER
jgi:hypothetical protein